MAVEVERTAENTPTWALAGVCAVFIVAGVTLSFLIETLEKRLRKARRKALAHSISKMKEELLQLGFISLLLVVFQNNVAHICIKNSVMNSWNPCALTTELKEEEGTTPSDEGGHARRLLGVLLSSRRLPWWRHFDGRRPIFPAGRGRMLTEATNICKEGHTSIVSVETLHQLHLYLFLLACVHILYSLLALLVASLRVRRMRTWEDEAQQTVLPQEIEENIRVPVAEKNRSFVHHHLRNPLSRNTYSVWIVCFFRQFTQGVTRIDYLSLRHGFVATHALGPKFDFHEYLLRSLEIEFPSVVGITPFLWLVFVLCLGFNVHGTHLYFWVSLVPLVLLLAVGTKLQHVIATLALDSAGVSHHGRFANSAVAPRDNLFWFKQPKLIGFITHYIVFQDAFEITNFLGFIWAFGLDGCILAGKAWVYTRVALSIIIQILVSYQILPLYAVVIQMGSHASPAIFKQNVRERLTTWRKDAVKRARLRPVFEEGPSIPGESVLGDKFDMDGPSYEDIFTHPRSQSVQQSYKHSLTSRDPSKNDLARVSRSTSEPIPEVAAMLGRASLDGQPLRSGPHKIDRNEL